MGKDTKRKHDVMVLYAVLAKLPFSMDHHTHNLCTTTADALHREGIID